MALAAIRSAAFRPGWAEWNDRYRDNVRSFWIGGKHELPNLAKRSDGFGGDLYADRRPEALGERQLRDRTMVSRCNDLVSYNEKHNEANGEDNRDGRR